VGPVAGTGLRGKAYGSKDILRDTDSFGLNSFSILDAQIIFRTALTCVDQREFVITQIIPEPEESLDFSCSAPRLHALDRPTPAQEVTAVRSAAALSMIGSMVTIFFVDHSESLTEESDLMDSCADPVLSVASPILISECLPTSEVVRHFQIGFDAIASATPRAGSAESVTIVSHAIGVARAPRCAPMSAISSD
jgi:hypothetical protein